MATVSGTVTIEDPIGLHARPAGQIVKLVRDSGYEIRMGRQGESLVKASSPLSLMSLKGKQGEVLSVEIDTDDQSRAEELISAIQGFLKG
jgi:phosphotransferase system HPr (HPr) family protein